MVAFLYKNIFSEMDLSDLMLFITCNLIIINTVNSYFMQNPIYSLIFLIINYCLSGLLFIYNGFVFMGLIFVLIYVGAVSILLIFTLMLLNLKSIYYKTENNLKFYVFIFFIFFVEFCLFYVSLQNYYISFFDYYLYTNWFKVLFFKSDFVAISYQLILLNSELLLIVGLLLLVILVASVSMIITVKDSKKQDKYSQLKNYNKNIIK